MIGQGNPIYLLESKTPSQSLRLRGGEKEDNGQLEHAMVAVISEIKVIDPQSLEEAMRRPDYPK